MVDDISALGLRHVGYTTNEHRHPFPSVHSMHSSPSKPSKANPIHHNGYCHGRGHGPGHYSRNLNKLGSQNLQPLRPWAMAIAMAIVRAMAIAVAMTMAMAVAMDILGHGHWQ